MSQELADDVVLRPLLDELGSATLALAIVVSLVRKLLVQKQPSPRAPMAAPYATRATRSYTTPWDTSRQADERALPRGRHKRDDVLSEKAKFGGMEISDVAKMKVLGVIGASNGSSPTGRATLTR